MRRSGDDHGMTVPMTTSMSIMIGSQQARPPEARLPTALTSIAHLRPPAISVNRNPPCRVTFSDELETTTAHSRKSWTFTQSTAQGPADTLHHAYAFDRARTIGTRRTPPSPVSSTADAMSDEHKVEHDPSTITLKAEWTNSGFGRTPLQLSRESLTHVETDAHVYMQPIMSLGTHAAKRTHRGRATLPKQLAWAIWGAPLAVLVMVEASPAFAEVRIFACEPEWAALASEVGGDAVSVYAGTHGRQDPHYIRMRPSLIEHMRRADVLFCTGAGLEDGWLPVLLQLGAGESLQHGQPGHLIASEHVRLLDPPTVVDRRPRHVHAEGNPHVQLLPENIGYMATELARRLVVIDPENTETYRQQLSAFQERWRSATAGWMERSSRLAGMPVVAYHEAWAYLYEWTGVRQAAAIERLPGVPPTISHLQEVLELARSAGARAILRAPYEPTKGMEWLSDRAGIPIVELPFTVGGSEGVDTLFDLFDVTLARLEEVHDQY